MNEDGKASVDCSQSPIFFVRSSVSLSLTVTGGHLAFLCTERVGVGVYSPPKPSPAP